MGGIGGYGRGPGYSPPIGRRKWSWTGEPERAYRGIDVDLSDDDTPTTDWASLIRSGYSVVYGVLFEGIPYAFLERELYTVLGSEAIVPGLDYTASAALFVTPGMAVSCEIDREKGVAAGRSIDIVLRRQSLEDEGVATALFKTPSVTAVLQTEVTDPTTAIFEVDATTSWTAPGTAYIGRELIRYTTLGTSGTAGASLEGVTRAVCGLPHYHIANASSGYAVIQNTPRYWRGRLVTIYEHLVGPDGRYLGVRTCVNGEYCRQLWRGYVDAEPQDSAAGKTIRCLPAVRLAGGEVGAKFALDVAQTDWGSPLLWFTDADVMRLRGDASGSTVGSGPHNGALGYFAPLEAWATRAAADIESDLTSAEARVSAQVSLANGGGSRVGGVGINNIRVSVYFPGSAALNGLSIQADAWFIPEGSYQSGSSRDPDFAEVVIPVALSASRAWLVVRAPPSEDFEAADVPDAGTAIIESDGQREVVQWDARVIGTSAQADLVGLRLSRRGIDGTPVTDPWFRGGKVTLVSGSAGTWTTVFRELLTSSGTGARGPSDRFGFGVGVGFPESWLDASSLDDEPMASHAVNAISDERRSLVDILGGWLALWQRCLVQRRNDNGEIVLSPVSTRVVDDPTATAVTTDDVLLGGHGAPEPIEAPNTIKVTSVSFTNAGPTTNTIINRDTARVQGEGQRMWELQCPLAEPDNVNAHAWALLSQLDGQSVVSFEGPPWCELQPGDRITLETAHPTVYDWASGAWAPASVNGVISSVERDLWSGVVRLSAILQGRASAYAWLCPSARVIRVASSTSLEVEAGHEAHFTAGDAVAIYEPGNETTNTQTTTVSSIDTAAHTITFGASLSAFVLASAGLCYVTFNDYAAAANDQASYMFVRSDKRWR